ncbi:ankyrin repeat domain-containing protein [Candidatus Babeliales bacterium]|nr:ankyrin repeat domain-containing protein [Candidatus Babeliales bacterium]
MVKRIVIMAFVLLVCRSNVHGAAQGSTSSDSVCGQGSGECVRSIIHPDQCLRAALECSPGLLRMVAVYAALKNGADPNMVCSGGIIGRPLHILANDYVQAVCLAELLCQHGAALEAKAKGGLGPLHLAAKFRNYNYAQFLLQKGADVNAQSRTFFTPLAWAVNNSDIKMVQLLLEHGASVMVQGRDGRTVFSYCVDNDIRELLEEYYEKEKQKEKEAEEFKEKLMSAVFD